MKTLNNIIETGLILLIVFTPFALGSVHIRAYTLMELTVLLLVVIWFIKMINQGEICIPKTPLNIPILLFICLIFFQLIPLPEYILKVISPNTHRIYSDTINSLSTASTTGLANSLSLYPYATKTELLKFMSYIGVFFLIIGNITTGRQINRLIMAIVITGFLVSIFALIQSFTWNGKIYWVIEFTRGASPFGPFINKNNFAGYINLIIPVALSMFMMKRDNNKKALFGFMAVVMATAIFLSMSRGGVFAFSGGLIFMGFLLLFRRGGYRKGGLILGGFLSCLLLYLIYVGIGPAIERLATLTEKETYLREQRWTVWLATTGIIRDFPFFGTGLDTFEMIFPIYKPLKIVKLRYIDAHNDYIQFVSETGIAGVLIGITFFIILFKKAFSSLNNPKLMTQDYLLIGALSSVSAFMLSITLTFNTHIPANALLFAIVLAIVVKLSGENKRRRGIKDDRAGYKNQAGY
ncbi:MAG: O-antigen ligase family protein [Thermodesulfobacteriota bacterium]